MRFRSTVCLLTIFALSVSIVSPGIVTADEGMWPFNNVPRAQIKQRYGFDVTDEWLHKVQLASVRFNNGGSGSFVSSDGLVMTNHHIASDTLQNLSSPQKDYVKDGFYAPTHAEEARAPDLELNVLDSIEDVTTRVNANVTASMSTAEAQNARKASINSIAEESKRQTGLRSDVVTLFQGGQYNLYRYKMYTDVRLVFAPQFEIAFLGGDPDNFEYPRYDLDLALFRVYENGQPLHSENFFKWSSAGAKDGELVFTSGSPGSTSRLNTVAHLEYLRDFGYPLLLRYLASLKQTLDAYGKTGAEQKRTAQEELFSVENSIKARAGGLKGLQNVAVMTRKRREEAALKRSVTADAKLRARFGDPWAEIAKARSGLVAYEVKRRMLEVGWAFNTVLFGYARTLVRLASESAKPNAQRLPMYTDAARPSLELELFSPAPIYVDFETAKLTDSLAFMQSEMPAANPLVRSIMNGKTPRARAEELIGGSKLNDVEVRKQLAAGGAAALDASTDPMIVLARSIDADSRAVLKRYDDELTSAERTNYAKLAQAVFALKGNAAYPDATFTLRLSYGAVKGYKSKGRFVQPFTDFAGLYKHSAEHGDIYPYHLPEIWQAHKSALDLSTPFNFVTTNDITGGNSGSPIFNSRAEIVGLIFDGNIKSLLGDFVYDETVNRSVGVDSRGMLEALKKIYNAQAVVTELTR